ncbi:MAG TPA: hypothetical protein V6C97_05330 [Oculatellaceae cyanobacterium]
MKTNTLIKLTAGAAVVGLLLLFVFSSFGYRDTMVGAQNGVQSAYNINRTHLASYVREVETNTGLANLHMQNLDKFIEAAVSGRYRDAEGKANAATDPTKTGTFFSSMHEAYPQLPDTKIELVMKEVEVQEAKFAHDQEGLSEQIKAWDNKRMASANLLYGLLPWCHFPTNDLVAKGPDGSELHGKPALDHMRELVSSAASDKAYGNNEFDGVNIPK